MKHPLQVTFHNLPHSDALEHDIKERVGKLEALSERMIGCRVVIEIPNKSQKASGNPPDVHIVVRIPNKEIVVSREYKNNGHKKAANDAYAVLDDAFTVAQQQLKDYRRISHGDVKYKSGEPRGASGESGL